MVLSMMNLTTLSLSFWDYALETAIRILNMVPYGKVPNLSYLKVCKDTSPECLCLNVEIEEHSLRDLNEPTNYKAAMLDPESNKWLNAINAEMESMKDNQVSCLVDLPHNEAAMEAVWIRKFISGLGIVPTINEPIKMFWDNSAAFLIANELGVQKGARHYHRRYHYVRECIELGEINLLKVHTNGNLAYPFTKILSKKKAYSNMLGAWDFV
nr:retrovirus-related Pol polyprotein from transposon TNT 1-94 [Tanacetum cinerariifolium]